MKKWGIALALLASLTLLVGANPPHVSVGRGISGDVSVGRNSDGISGRTTGGFWSGGKQYVVCITADDGYTINTSWSELADSMGFSYTLCLNAADTTDQDAHLDPSEVLLVASRGVEIVSTGEHHNAGTAAWGMLKYSTSDSISQEISYQFINDWTGLSLAPTNFIVDIGPQNYIAASRMRDTHGYLGARSIYHDNDNGGFKADAPGGSRWDKARLLDPTKPSNIYGIASFQGYSTTDVTAAVFGGDEPVATTLDSLAVRSQRLLFDVSAANGYAPIPIVIHGSEVSRVELEHFVTYLRERGDTWIATFGQMVAYYRSRLVPVDPPGWARYAKLSGITADSSVFYGPYVAAYTGPVDSFVFHNSSGAVTAENYTRSITTGPNVTGLLKPDAATVVGTLTGNVRFDFGDFPLHAAHGEEAVLIGFNVADLAGKSVTDARFSWYLTGSDYSADDENYHAVVGVTNPVLLEGKTQSDMSWDYSDVSTTTAWSVDLDTYDSIFDYGDFIYPSNDLSALAPGRASVSVGDYIQWVLDSGGDTAMFMLTGERNTSTYTVLPQSHQASTAGNRPYLVATFKSDPPAFMLASSGTDTVTLNWGSVNNAASYNIYRGEGVTAGATLFKTGITDSTYYDIAAAADSFKTYRVSAVMNLGWESAWSDSSSAKFFAGADSSTVPPARPVLGSIPVDHYEHHLTWTASADPDFDHYEVHRGSAVIPSVTATTLFADNILTSSFDFAWDQGSAVEATFDSLHTWQIVAVDDLGNKSSKSNTRSSVVHDLVAPSAPEDLFVSALAPTSADTAKYYVSWSAVEDTTEITYTLYRSQTTEPEQEPFAPTTTETSISGQFAIADLDSVYYFSVRATDASGITSSSGSNSDGTSWRVSPSVSAFSLDGVADDAGDAEVTVSATFSRVVTPELFVWRDNDDPTSDAAKDSLDFSSGALIDSVAVTSTMAWPTADADSTFEVTWNRATPIPTTGYLVQGQRNDGAWVTLGDTTTITPTDSTLTVNKDSGDLTDGELRGKWLVRCYGVSDGLFSQVAVADSLLYNDAIEVHGRLRIYDTVSERYGWSSVVSRLGIVYDDTPDETAPDTTGTFVSASIDTTDRTAATTGVIMRLTLDAAEAVKSDFQWKALYDGDWSAADDYDPAAATALEYTDTIPTGMSTDTFFGAFGDTTGGTGVYLRYRLRDAALNVSPYVRITGDSDEALVFPRAAEAAGDTILYVFSNSSTGYSISGDTISYQDAVATTGAYEQTWTGEIHNITNTGFYDSELNYRAPTIANTSSTQASIYSGSVSAGRDWFPMNGDAGTLNEQYVLMYFGIDSLDVSDTILNATLYVVSESGGATDGGYLRVAGMTTAAMDDWVGTANNASYEYYDVTGTSAWATDLDTYSVTADVSSVAASDTTYSGGTWPSAMRVIWFDAGDIVSAWAGGANNGGFLIGGGSGTASSDYQTFQGTGDTTAARRPYLMVWIVR